MGVEYEYLQDLNEAMNAINQASTIAKLHLGKDNYVRIEETNLTVIDSFNDKNRRI